MWLWFRHFSASLRQDFQQFCIFFASYLCTLAKTITWQIFYASLSLKLKFKANTTMWTTNVRICQNYLTPINTHGVLFVECWPGWPWQGGPNTLLTVSKRGPWMLRRGGGQTNIWINSQGWDWGDLDKYPPLPHLILNQVLKGNTHLR